MTGNFQDSNTFRNLQEAFKGETSASGKYAMYGKKAEEDGYMQIANIFNETSGNEREHAEMWMKLMHGGEVPSTLENLQESFSGEEYERATMYPGFAEEAIREGYPEIAALFYGVADIENHHNARFRQLADNIMNDRVFCKDTAMVWICLNCGNLYYGECAPEVCPVCGYPQGYYQLNCENY